VNRPVVATLPELLGAVERIDDPDAGLREPRIVSRGLFAEDSVVRVASSQNPL
jgi:hypothetical protein